MLWFAFTLYNIHTTVHQTILYADVQLIVVQCAIPFIDSVYIATCDKEYDDDAHATEFEHGHVYDDQGRDDTACLCLRP